MRRKIGALVASTGIIVAMSLSAVMVQAQSPAGPNRPPQVPAEYIVTPFGYFHPSCVAHLAPDEVLLEGGLVIQKADGTVYPGPVCEYPHYTARGEMFANGSAIEPPTISHSWIVAGSVSDDSSYGEVVANWNVPSTPLSFDDQVLYFFPGLEDQEGATTILQPVLGFNADFTRGWGIASLELLSRGHCGRKFASPCEHWRRYCRHGQIDLRCWHAFLSDLEHYDPGPVHWWQHNSEQHAQ